MYVQNNQSGLGVAPVVLATQAYEGIKALANKLNPFGESEEYKKRHDLSAQHYEVLKRLREFIANPQTPAFILPKATLLEITHGFLVDNPTGATMNQFKVDNIRERVAEIQSDIAAGSSTIPANWPYAAPSNTTGRALTYNFGDIPNWRIFLDKINEWGYALFLLQPISVGQSSSGLAVYDASDIKKYSDKISDVTFTANIPLSDTAANAAGGGELIIPEAVVTEKGGSATTGALVIAGAGLLFYLLS
jgi:hypothetical protein